MKTLSVGIGCRLHSSAEQIEAAVRDALGSHAFEDIGAIASIDIKAHETGLLEFCARHALPLKLFSRAQIAALPVNEPSAAAREHLGIDGVCEPCALLAAQARIDAANPPDSARGAAASDESDEPDESIASPAPRSLEARLLARKTAHHGITVAIAAALARPALEPTPNDIHEQDSP